MVSIETPRPQTSLALTGIPVIAVQITSTDRARLGVGGDEVDDDTADPTVADAPERQVLVTLAVTTAQAEEVVAALEFGTVWFTRNREGAVLG